jgi:hypothetical protein
MRPPEGGNKLSGGQTIRFVMHEADRLVWTQKKWMNADEYTRLRDCGRRRS